MSSTNTLEEQIAALVRQLEETREAKKRKEVEWKEAEAVAERAHQEEQRRLREEAEACLKRERRNVEECRVEQERREQEEEEARHRRSCQESKRAQESQRCDSCERRDVECIQIKVSDEFLIFFSNLLPTV